MNYLRKDASYDGWGLHAWNTSDCDGLAEDAVTDWAEPLTYDSVAANGAIYKIPMKEGGTCFNFIMHKGDEKEPGGDRQWDMSVLGDTVYIVQGKADISETPISLSVYEGQKGALIDSTTVAWDTGSADSFEVHYLAEGGFEVDDATGQETSTSEMLFLTSKDLPAGTAKRYDNYKAFGFKLPDGVDEATLISGQLVLVAKNAEGKVIDATGIQLAPALDAVYATGDTGAQNEMLGAVVTGDSTAFRLWAPTAKSVSLSLYNDDLTVFGAPVAMTRKANGTWETADIAGVVSKYYRYTVEVYHATLDKVETLEVTDPYSLSLSANSKYSQVVDLKNQAKPSGCSSSR